MFCWTNFLGVNIFEVFIFLGVNVLGVSQFLGSKCLVVIIFEGLRFVTFWKGNILTLKSFEV